MEDGVQSDPNKQATELLFSCKKSPNLFSSMVLLVPKVNQQKHLGLVLDSKLSFERNINEKITKAKKVFIYRFQYFVEFIVVKDLHFQRFVLNFQNFFREVDFAFIAVWYVDINLCIYIFSRDNI